MARKEAILNKINKTWNCKRKKISIVSEMSKHQRSKIWNSWQQDLELLEQAQGQERLYRKRNKVSKKHGANATTEEALLTAAANRKISRKINYDAVSAILDDDGTFATGAGNSTPGVDDMDEVMVLPGL